MPKLKPVTEEEIKAATESAYDLMATLADISNRLEKSFTVRLPNCISTARAINALTRTCAELTTQLLVRGALEEDKRELEKMLRAHQKAQEGKNETPQNR